MSDYATAIIRKKDGWWQWWSEDEFNGAFEDAEAAEADLRSRHSHINIIIMPEEANDDQPSQGTDA